MATSSAPRDGLGETFLGSIRSVATAISVPHGYTLSITGSFAGSAGLHGFPDPLSTWLFVIGASCGFLLTAVRSPRFRPGSGANRPAPSHFLAVVPGIAAPAAVAVGAVAPVEPLRFFLAGVVATAAYVVLVAAGTRLGGAARRRR